MTDESANPKPVKERAVSFSRPEQVVAILSEAYRLKLQVLLKYSATGKSVRGAVDHFDTDTKTLRISGISPAGDELLKGHYTLRVEFILQSTKLVFVSEVTARSTGKIALSLPAKLVAIERRNNSRIRVPASFAVFVEFQDQKIDPSRFDAPFVPAAYREGENLISRLRVDDVSLGGFACFTRFNAVAELLKPDKVGYTATLHFPDMSQLQVPVSLRWSKKSVVAVQSGQHVRLLSLLSQKLKTGLGGEELLAKEVYYRVGLQFSEVSKELDATLRLFIRQIQQAESI